MKFSHSEGDIDLTLYGSDGEVINSSTSSDDNEMIEYQVLQSGYYYIKVFYGDKGNLYDMRWNAVAGGSTGTITHHGMTYSTVTSPETGKIWLDRNIGAFRACTASDDVQCYGDYFQWGRGIDGHEKKNSSATTETVRNPSNVTHGNFIIGHSDWVSSIGGTSTRASTWSATDGNSVCPAGFRVPKTSELLREFQNARTRTQLLNNFLKLPLAGCRNWQDGTMKETGNGWAIWSIGPMDDSSSYRFNASSCLGRKASGFSVRCIKATR